MRKLIHVDKMDPPPGITKLGGFNDMPEPWTQIEVGRYLYLSRSWAGYRDYRQIHLAGWKCVREVFIDFYTHYGLAIAYPDSWEHHNGLGRCDDEARYYYLGCVHEWRELSPEECRGSGIHHFGMFDHHYLCTRCGARTAHDSS